jgi:hypothetical protein
MKSRCTSLEMEYVLYRRPMVVYALLVGLGCHTAPHSLRAWAASEDVVVCFKSARAAFAAGLLKPSQVAVMEVRTTFFKEDYPCFYRKLLCNHLGPFAFLVRVCFGDK